VREFWENKDSKFLRKKRVSQRFEKSWEKRL
jgi:hypothetical protein